MRRRNGCHQRHHRQLLRNSDPLSGLVGAIGGMPCWPQGREGSPGRLVTSTHEGEERIVADAMRRLGHARAFR